MTAILTQLGVSAPDNFGYAQLPSLAKCLNYHLLMGATPLANLIAGGQPLANVGSGPLTYEADCAVLQGANGLVTTETTNDNNRSAIMVSADAYRTMATPSAPTVAIGTATGDSRYMTWAGGATVYQRGSTMFYATDAANTAQVFGNGYRTQDLPVYFPDGVIRRGRFAMLGITSDGTTAKLYLQNGGIVEIASLPAAVSSGSPHPLTIGVGDGATTRWRCAAVAQFTAFASDVEMFANMAFIAADVEASGTIDFSPFGRDLAA